MGTLADVGRNWEIYARADPMWAVLMDPSRIGRRWDPAEFFSTGQSEVATVLEHLDRLGLPIDFTASALDFGCGPGRLTQALAGRFASVWGVDISSTMINLAVELNRYPLSCRYVLNQTDDLTCFESEQFAFIYTSIVLQHVEPRYSRRYLAEFARLLSPGGTLVFQLPDHSQGGSSIGERLRHEALTIRRHLALRARARRILRRTGVLHAPADVHDAVSEMHCISEPSVREILSSVGLRLIEVRLTNSTDLSFVGSLRFLTTPPTVGYASKQYCAIKPV